MSEGKYRVTIEKEPEPEPRGPVWLIVIVIVAGLMLAGLLIGGSA